MKAGRGRAWRWVTTSLFRSYLVSFLILWAVAKTVVAGSARYYELSPFGFRPYHESWACVLELLVLGHFIRRRGEDVLLGNLGLDSGSALLPFALLHFALSGAASALVR